MEGKGLRTSFGTLLLGVLILCLFVAQTKVEALSCCQGPWGRTCYIACQVSPIKVPFVTCDTTCGCIQASTCPPGYPSITPLRSSAASAINEFCKFGCASSVCNVAISTRDPVVNEAIERCNNACSDFCAKGSTNALEMA